MDPAARGEVDHPGGNLKRFALCCGVAVPILYYGTQFAAMAFYPGYRILAQVASELGSNQSTQPMVFNAGAVLTGIAALIAAFGFLRAIPNRVLAWLVFLGMLSNGAAGMWAGIHPLPDPRHNPGAIGAGMFFLPLLFIFATWRLGSPPLAHLPPREPSALRAARSGDGRPDGPSARGVSRCPAARRGSGDVRPDRNRGGVSAAADQYVTRW